jgi:hypothetical protein
MKAPYALAFGLAGWVLAASPARADVTLTMNNGRVTLVAKDATVRQILTEWARVGQTKIVNLERIPGGPVSMELSNVPEAQALDVLLRSVAGYVAAPRPVDAANLSHFDRIVVMPTSAAPRPTSSATPAPPAFAQPQAGQQAPDAEEDGPPGPNTPPFGPNRGPIFNTPQQPQVVTPQMGPPPAAGQPAAATPASSQPAAPGIFPRAPSAPSSSGVSVPGMIVPSPQPAPGTQPASAGRGGGPGGE